MDESDIKPLADDVVDAALGDTDAAVKVMRRIAAGEFDDRAIRYFVQLAARAILTNIDAGKKLGADRAFRLVKSAHRPLKNERRDFKITWHVESDRQQYGKLAYAIAKNAEFWGLPESTIQTIYKRNIKKLKRVVHETFNGEQTVRQRQERRKRQGQK